jgi:hypothetical protein
MPKTIDLQPVWVERTSPGRFLEVYQKDPENIDAIRIVAPRLGSKSFGSIMIKYKSPVYKSPFEEVFPTKVKKKLRKKNK